MQSTIQHGINIVAKEFHNPVTHESLCPGGVTTASGEESNEMQNDVWDNAVRSIVTPAMQE